jgi:hypothetical protein
MYNIAYCIYIYIYIYTAVMDKNIPHTHKHTRTNIDTHSDPKYTKPTRLPIPHTNTHTHTLLEDITTEPHAHDISADIVRVWLSGYILQHTPP